jgi:hypothetical protein
MNKAFTEPPPNFIATNFDRNIVTVVDSLKEFSTAPQLTAARGLQEALLLGLADSKVGLYSKYHDRAVYKYGLAAEKTIHYGYMFAICLLLSDDLLMVYVGLQPNLIPAKLAFV